MSRPASPAAPLGPPAVYFPIARGVYDVVAGLRPLGTDFGNGPADGHVFQLDADWPRYRANKLACRADRLGKYVARADLDEPAAVALVEGFADRLTAEHPRHFRRDGGRLCCDLTGDTVDLTADPFDAFDHLAMQVQEDVCLTRVDGDRDWLAAGHVCSPSHWSVERKVGLPFTAVHEPVPGIGPITRSAAAFVRLMVDRGPFVRFAWGFATDARLNHHPDVPPGVEAADWRGRRFDPGRPRLFLRVERQVTWGLPAVAAAAFTIPRVARGRRGDPGRPRPSRLAPVDPAVDVAGGPVVQGAGRVGRRRGRLARGAGVTPGAVRAGAPKRARMRHRFRPGLCRPLTLDIVIPRKQLRPLESRRRRAPTAPQRLIVMLPEASGEAGV